MFGPEYFKTMAYQECESGTLLCEDCFTGSEDGWERVTEAMLDDMTYEDEGNEDEGATVRPVCDNCFRTYLDAKGQWLDAGELEAALEVEREEDRCP